MYFASLLVAILNIFYYLNLYYVVTPHQYADQWQYGYKQMIQKITPLENQYDQIIVTSLYDQPHIFFAFYQKIDPKEYQQFAETASQGFSKYTFKRIDYQKDAANPNTLIVADPDSTPTNIQPFDQVYLLNGQVAFNLISIP